MMKYFFTLITITFTIYTPPFPALAIMVHTYTIYIFTTSFCALAARPSTKRSRSFCRYMLRSFHCSKLSTESAGISTRCYASSCLDFA